MLINTVIGILHFGEVLVIERLTFTGLLSICIVVGEIEFGVWIVIRLNELAANSAIILLAPVQKCRVCGESLVEAVQVWV